MSMEEHVSDADLLDRDISGPTVLEDAVGRLSHLVELYLTEAGAAPDSRLTPEARARSAGGLAWGRGQVAFLDGDHGSGKTHAIRYALGQAADLAGRFDAIRLYVKAQDADFVALYQRLMSQVGRALLRELSLQFLRVLATERAGRWPSNSPESQILASARRDPEQVGRLFTDLLVERGAVLETQAVELARVTENGDEFQRALSHLLNPSLEDAAYAWFTGREPAPDDAERLGVSGPINDRDRCRFGLQLLTVMCARIGRPLIVVVDQCERLVVERPDNMGTIHSLVERMPQDNGMLLLAGNEASWRALSPDLRQRFGSNHFSLDVLSPAQARRFLSTYLDMARGDASVTVGDGLTLTSRSSGPPRIWPFTDSGVKALLALSGGNARKLLQMAWASLETARMEQAEVDGALVQKATEEVPLNEQDAARAVERWLLDEQVVYKRQWRDDMLSADFVVMSESGPRLIVEVVGPVFSVDETHRLRRSLELIRSRWAAEIVVLVLGYCEPAARQLLAQSAHEVILFDDMRALERLRGTTRVLEPLVIGPPGRVQPYVSDEFSGSTTEDPAVTASGTSDIVGSGGSTVRDVRTEAKTARPGTGRIASLSAGMHGEDDRRPYFFLSYARSRFRPDDGSDPDRWITKLFNDLCHDVGIITGTSMPGFMDRQLPVGAGWPDQVADALANCRVFLPLLSPAYFTSEYCGREWAAFIARAREQWAGLGLPRLIVPALWTRMSPGELPVDLRSMQYLQPDFPPQYAAEGFYGIMKLSRYREQYKQAVLMLARLIKDVAAESNLEVHSIPDYESLDNPFAGFQGRQGTRHLIRIVVAAHRLYDLPAGRDAYYYGRTVREWAPYRDAEQTTPLASYTERVISDLGYEPMVHCVGDPLPDAPDSPTVLLVDPWVSRHPGIRAELRRMDDGPVNVLVPFNQEDQETVAATDELSRGIDDVLGRGLALPGSVRLVSSLQAFRAALPRAVAEATARYFKDVPAHPPEVSPSMPRPILQLPDA